MSTKQFQTNILLLPLKKSVIAIFKYRRLFTMTAEKKNSQESKQAGDIKKKFTETLDSLKKNDKMESVVSYAQTHTLDTIAYAALLAGLIWMFWNPFFGGGLVGLVVGFYFSKELMQLFQNANSQIEKHGLAKSVVFAGAALAILLYLPGLVIGAALACVVSVLLKK
jgi:hypothetical protein